MQRIRFCTFLQGSFHAAFLLGLTYACHAEVIVKVEAENDAIAAGPVEFQVPENIEVPESFALMQGNQAVAAQWLNRDERRAAFILPTPIEKGGSIAFTLQAAANHKEDTPNVSISTENPAGAVTAFVGGHPVLSYWATTRMPPDSIPAVFKRSGHIHPLYTPGGEVVTSEFPADHAHQHGLFHAWVNTSLAGKKVDFWNQKGLTGNVRHVRLVSKTSGPVFAEFTAELEHVAIDADGSETPALRELLTVRVWNVSGPFMVDTHTVQTLVASTPLIVHEYHYGGAAIRGRDDWLDNPHANFLTSEGKSRVDGNHTRPEWVSMHGPTSNGFASVTIIGHRENLRFPQPVRLHPGKPYFVFTPPQLGEFIIDADHNYEARYRLLLQDSRPEIEQIEPHRAVYLSPPQVAVFHDCAN
ncbi:MAG: PmoA family protein [Planctomycetaceae bacterium]